MKLEHTLPYETSEGNKYLIRFSAFNPLVVPIEIKVPVINLELVQVEFVKQNGHAFLKYLAQYICDYINSFDVILYYYCDKSDISMRKNRCSTPQQYRHDLFSKLYATINNETLIRDIIIINDPENGDHYISLITSEKNAKELEILRREFDVFSDKN
jgi:hypothetical protein